MTYEPPKSLIRIKHAVADLHKATRRGLTLSEIAACYIRAKQLTADLGSLYDLMYENTQAIGQIDREPRNPIGPTE